jgi:hypothetical protein
MPSAARFPEWTRTSNGSIPLRKQDKDASLDLQALLEQVYRNGRYDDIDYSRTPDPPLLPEDTEWAAELLKRRTAE